MTDHRYPEVSEEAVKAAWDVLPDGTTHREVLEALQAAAPILQREAEEKREAVEAELRAKEDEIQEAASIAEDDASAYQRTRDQRDRLGRELAAAKEALDSARAEVTTSLLTDLEAEVEALRGRHARSMERRTERLDRVYAIKASGMKDIAEIAGLRAEAAGYGAVAAAAREDAKRLQDLVEKHKPDDSKDGQR